MMRLMPDKRICLITLLLLSFSCAKEALEPDFELLEAVAEQVPASSKADILDAGDFTWNADDCIAVHYISSAPSSQQYFKASLISGDGAYTAVFTSRKGGERDGYAIYPYEMADGSNPGTGTQDLAVHLPEKYGIDVSQPTSDNSPVPMVAVNAPGQKLLFKHVSAMFRLKLSGIPDGTKYITVSTDKNLCGPFRVDLTNPDTPLVPLTASLSVEDYTTVTYTLSAAVSAGSPAAVTLNLAAPAGMYANLCVTALNESGKTIGCINSGLDRLLERGRICLLEMDFTGTRRLASFTVKDMSIPVCRRDPLSLSVKQVSPSGGTESATGFTVSVLSISDRSVIAASVSGTSVNVTGLKVGEAVVRLVVSKGDDRIYADVPVTVTPATLDIYANSSYLYKSRFTNLKARLVSDSKDVSYSGLKYSWSIIEGAALARLEGSGSGVTLHSGINTGTVKVRCRVSAVEPDNPEMSLFTDLEIKIIEYPHGTTGGLFSVSKEYASEITQVCFARGNAYKLKSDGKYYFFDNPWEAYNGVVTTEEPEDALMMDCLDPMTVLTDFGNYRTSQPIWVNGEETVNWFMLSISQATYLLRTRKASKVGNTENARYVVVKVGDSFGVLLFPDLFAWPEELTVPSGINDIRSAALDLANKGAEGVPATNCYSLEEWREYLEPTGVVFLPGLASAPCFFSYDRYSDSGISSTYKRWHGQNRSIYSNDAEKIGLQYGAQNVNGYYQMYHCYYLNQGYMYFCAQQNTGSTYYVSDNTGVKSYMVYNMTIDWVRYFHLRPVRYEYNKVVK